MRRYLIGLLSLCSSATAFAAPESILSSWTNGGMLGSDAQVVTASLGWPGASVEYMKSLGTRFDLGARVTVNYSGEGVRNTWLPGAKISADAKIRLLGNETAQLIFRVSPGFFYYLDGPAQAWGFELPIEFDGGLRVSESVWIHAGVTVPFALGAWSTGLGNQDALQISVQPGAGVEWRVNPKLSLYASAKIGRYWGAFFAGPNGSSIAFEGLLAATYRL